MREELPRAARTLSARAWCGAEAIGLDRFAGTGYRWPKTTAGYKYFNPPVAAN
jgi:hypothetical protein